MDVTIITNKEDIETELRLAVLVLELNLLLIRMWGLRTDDWPENLTAEMRIHPVQEVAA